MSLLFALSTFLCPYILLLLRCFFSLHFFARSLSLIFISLRFFSTCLIANVPAFKTAPENVREGRNNRKYIDSECLRGVVIGCISGWKNLKGKLQLHQWYRLLGNTPPITDTGRYGYSNTAQDIIYKRSAIVREPTNECWCMQRAFEMQTPMLSSIWWTLVLLPKCTHWRACVHSDTLIRARAIHSTHIVRQIHAQKSCLNCAYPMVLCKHSIYRFHSGKICSQL